MIGERGTGSIDPAGATDEWADGPVGARWEAGPAAATARPGDGEPAGSGAGDAAPDPDGGELADAGGAGVAPDPDGGELADAGGAGVAPHPDEDRVWRDPARRTLWTAVVAVAAVLAAVATVVVRAATDGGEPEAPPAPVLGGGPPPDGTPVVVGPVTGADVAAYVASRHTVLVAIPAGERRLAVVSLAAYHSVAGADGLVLGEDPDAEILGHVVAARGGPPARVDGDLAPWVASARQAAQGERDALAELLPTVTDAEFVAFYEQELARFDATLASLDPAGDLVFAVVVRADAGALNRLALRPEVRLVDVAPAGVHGIDSVTALRPEETAVAGDPVFRP